MAIEIKVPQLPESVADGTLLDWNRQPGETVHRDDVLVEVETDKVVLEVPAPISGVLTEIRTASGETVTSEQVLAILDPAADTASPIPDADHIPLIREDEAAAMPTADEAHLMAPAVNRMVREYGLNPADIPPTGPGGRLTKEDVLGYIAREVTPDEDPETDEAVPEAPEAPLVPAPAVTRTLDSTAPVTPGIREEIREPMSRLRQTIAARLVQSQQTAAMLTTFNEVNMQPVMSLRSRHRDAFENTHGVRLGFMSFFVRASVVALQKFPLVNAYIDGTDIVRHQFHDIGIAVSSPRGLVVPILRNCEAMGFAEIESRIAAFGAQAKEGKIDLKDLTGGTFTITNGGVFGSLVSTPIINPPQSAILGMHAIQERPVVENGEVVVRPMMYLALSYDHRIIDGKEAVQFLVTIKQMVEDPARLLLGC